MVSWHCTKRLEKLEYLSPVSFSMPAESECLTGYWLLLVAELCNFVDDVMLMIFCIKVLTFMLVDCLDHVINPTVPLIMCSLVIIGLSD